MRLRRKLAILSVLLLLALILSSCGSQPANQQQQQYKFVGSIHSNIYHYPDCKWAQRIKPENQIWFSSPEEAKAAGYRPCRVCRPPG
ncbi:Ada metal-binding domain-containing protein [Desulfofundulus sp.]|uniref:Ada metal-binding domain-containing protein n=1 Tax=Desulfofundulus sp. TaxID=2282750 RepID=UPI003C775784